MTLAYKSATAAGGEGESPERGNPQRNRQRDYELAASQVLCQFVVNHAVQQEKAGTLVIGLFDGTGQPAHRLPLSHQAPGVWTLKAWMAVPSDSRIQFQVMMARALQQPEVVAPTATVLKSTWPALLGLSRLAWHRAPTALLSGRWAAPGLSLSLPCRILKTLPLSLSASPVTR